jgi:hypothetical protein
MNQESRKAGNRKITDWHWGFHTRGNCWRLWRFYRHRYTTCTYYGFWRLFVSIGRNRRIAVILVALTVWGQAVSQAQNTFIANDLTHPVPVTSVGISGGNYVSAPGTTPSPSPAMAITVQGNASGIAVPVGGKRGADERRLQHSASGYLKPFERNRWQRSRDNGG